MPQPTTKPFEREVLEGFAQLIAGNPEATVPVAWVDDWADPDAVYTPEQFGIYLDRYPQGPAASVTLADYTVSDDPSLSDSVIGVQLTIRHRDLNVVKAVAADVFNLFHGRQRGMLGSVTLVSSLRSSGTSIGLDSNERQGRTENYYLTVHRPSANRL